MHVSYLQPLTTLMHESLSLSSVTSSGDSSRNGTAGSRVTGPRQGLLAVSHAITQETGRARPALPGEGLSARVTAALAALLPNRPVQCMRVGDLGHQLRTEAALGPETAGRVWTP